jgi:ureidoacrylate peracid hydrolase
MTEALLRDLRDLTRPEHSALIIIDPQHDFCSENGALAKRFGFDMKDIQDAVPRLNALIQECRDRGILVVWVREVFSDDKLRSNQKAKWGSGDDIWLIKEGTPGVEWYEGMIKPLPDEPVITKWQYDAFEDTDLALLLQSRNIKTLLMSGFTTNVCVETTARHGYIKGYHIVLFEDCAASTTPAEHESAVFNIGHFFGTATTAPEVLKIWSEDASEPAASPEPISEPA